MKDCHNDHSEHWTKSAEGLHKTESKKGSNMKAQHTPTPWVIDPSGSSINAGDALGRIADMKGDYIWPSEDKANAAFIVQACNSHQALVDALEATEGTLDWMEQFASEGMQAECDKSLAMAREALALAKGK
jgi:hypothetical protein